jgi:hypothetical protein
MGGVKFGFREGNIPAGAGMADFIKKCLEAMPVSKTITYLRGDSALYQAGVINLCFERGSLFTITALYHAIATNREEEAPEVIKLHNQRGQVVPDLIRDLISRHLRLALVGNGGFYRFSSVEQGGNFFF